MINIYILTNNILFYLLLYILNKFHKIIVCIYKKEIKYLKMYWDEQQLIYIFNEFVLFLIVN